MCIEKPSLWILENIACSQREGFSTLEKCRATTTSRKGGREKEFWEFGSGAPPFLLVNRYRLSFLGHTRWNGQEKNDHSTRQVTNQVYLRPTHQHHLELAVVLVSCTASARWDTTTTITTIIGSISHSRLGAHKRVLNQGVYFVLVLLQKKKHNAKNKQYQQNEE